MGKRCDVIRNGKACEFLAEDGTCLLDPNDLAEKCPAREKVGHEDKDDWITDINRELM